MSSSIGLSECAQARGMAWHGRQIFIQIGPNGFLMAKMIGREGENDGILIVR